MRIRQLLSLFAALFYPDTCVVCQALLLDGENGICSACLQRLPKTRLHDVVDNSLEQRFWGKTEVSGVTAFYYFEKGSAFQKIVYTLKYRHGETLGRSVARYAAAELADSARFSSFDAIVPVPLHPNKLKLRGYNQSRAIADGLADVLEIPVDETTLYRAIENPTQTTKSVYERWVNTGGIFALTDADAFRGKRLLLVDDVLTTGSTLIACVEAIRAVCEVDISLFTLAAVP